MPATSEGEFVYLTRKCLLFLLLTLSLVFLNACTQNNKKRVGIDAQPLRQASPEVSESFDVEKNDLNHNKKNNAAEGELSVDKAHVVIKKSALEKEFLLSSNILSQTPTPMFSSLQSRVVSFILRGHRVYLLDVTKNNAIAFESNIPQSLLIAEFPVLNETETALEIDFNAGMKQIFTAGDMFASDDPSYSGQADYQLPTAHVHISYLDEVSVNKSALFIRQVAQIAAKNMEVPVEVRYQIKPYLPDVHFEPVKSPGFSKVGYFEAQPLLLADGSTQIYAMKWNEKKPIQFAISANTPEKYRELVKNALLYWNKALGDGAIEVVQLTDKNITAPHFDLNIIQWSDWDSAGYAFADAHVDPRSGEVTSAQIFFPSAFMEGAVSKRIRLVESSRPVVALKGFKSATLCRRSLNADFANREMGQEVSAAAMDKAVRDYVYEVIAHELGHVLGLRHNFAASLASNYDYKDRKDLILSYYKKMKAPEGIIASNSVMEYSLFEESAWNADLLQNANGVGTKALTYDEMAIKYLYFKTPLPLVNRPLFCTDTDIQLYADCNQNDAGRSIISTASGAYQFNINSLAGRLINIYIASSKQRESLASTLIPVGEVNLNGSELVKKYAYDLAKLMSLMKDGAQFVAVRSQHVPIFSPLRPEIEKLEKEYLQSEVIRLGGLEQLLKELPVDIDTALVLKFSALLDDPLYNSGVLPDGTKYSFSVEEIAIMKKQIALLAPQLKEQLILNEIKSLSGANFSFAQYGQEAAEEPKAWMDSDLTYELPQILLNRFQNYALAKTEQKLVSEISLIDGTKKQVELPVYKYSQNIRLAAVGLLSNEHKAIDWAYNEKKKMGKLIEEELSLLGSEDEVDMNSLDRHVLQWYLNNKKVLSAAPE